MSIVHISTYQCIICRCERVYLRQLTAEDADFIFELNSNVETMRYTGDKPFKSIREAKAFLKHYSDYQQYGYGRWAVCDNNTHEILGWCGLKYHADIAKTDLGFRFLAKYCGQGYATEASLACLWVAFNVCNLHAVIGRAKKENTASINVLQKVGMLPFPNIVSSDWQMFTIEKLGWDNRYTPK